MKAGLSGNPSVGRLAWSERASGIRARTSCPWFFVFNSRSVGAGAGTAVFRSRPNSTQVGSVFCFFRSPFGHRAKVPRGMRRPRVWVLVLLCSSGSRLGLWGADSRPSSSSMPAGDRRDSVVALALGFKNIAVLPQFPAAPAGPAA